MKVLHPRPDCARANWLDLRGEWQFAYDDRDVGLTEGWERAAHAFDKTITVPFPPESEMSGIGDTGYHPVVWYRLETQIDKPGTGRRILRFGAVDYRADVWVNGRHVVTHQGGHTPFAADITASLAEEGPQVIVVRAEDRPGASGQARGKQDWQAEPHAIWYHRTTGIWQPVWVETVPDIYIKSLHLTPDIVDGTVRVEGILSGDPRRGARLGIEISKDDGVLAASEVAVSSDTVAATLHISGIEHGEDRSQLLWSPQHPNLLDVTVELTADGQNPDRIESYTGMRSCGVEGGRFILNDKPCFVRSVLEQGYWPQSHLAAPGDEAIRREVELIKALGFNAVRLHQKIEDPRFIYWCDRLGLLVWGEMPSAYAYSPDMAQSFMREWMEAVERDRSHPSIVTWVPLNESWGVPEISRRPDQQAFARALYHMTKAMDPTRPVIANDGWEHTVTDIAGIHDYSTHGDDLRERYATADSVRAAVTGFGPQRRRVALQELPADVPVMITEFGGISYAPREGEAWFGYETADTPEAYFALVSDLFAALHDSAELAGYCYTQLTDTLQERNGLLDENREPKFEIAALRRIITAPARAIPAETLEAARARAIARETNVESVLG